MRALNKFFVYLFIVFIFASVILVVYKLFIQTLGSAIPFDTDEADHANAALELYTFLTSGDLFGSVKAVFRQAFYPPVHSFFVVLSYFITGTTFAATRIPSVVLFLIYLLILFLAVNKFLKIFDKNHTALLASLITIFYAATSPITIANSVLAMLELPALFFISVLIYYFVSIKNSQVSFINVWVLAILSIIIFLTKYNFGILVIPGVFLTLLFTNYKLINLKTAGTYLIIVVALIGLWVICTDQESFLHFFVGHKSYAPLLSYNNLTFEMRVLINEYFTNSTIAIFIICLAALGSFYYFKFLPVKFTVFTFVCSLLILILSTTNESRHFIIALPCLLFLAGLGIFYCLALNYKVLGILLVVCIFNNCEFFNTFDQNISQSLEGKPEYADSFKFIFEQIESDLPVIINGISDDFSIEALRWYVAANSKQAYSKVNLDAYPYRDDKNFTARKRKRNLDAPYKLKNFDKAPLNKVFEKNYYKYAVIINNAYRPQTRFKNEALEFARELGKFNFKELSLGVINVKVYKLL